MAVGGDDVWPGHVVQHGGLFSKDPAAIRGAGGGFGEREIASVGPGDQSFVAGDDAGTGIADAATLPDKFAAGEVDTVDALLAK